MWETGLSLGSEVPVLIFILCSWGWGCMSLAPPSSCVRGEGWGAQVSSLHSALPLEGIPKIQLIPSRTALIQHLDSVAPSLRLSVLGWALLSFSCPPGPWGSFLNTTFSLLSSS